MAGAAKFDRCGDVGVLRVADVPEPGEVLVRVHAASVNTGEVDIREGRMDSMFPATFPEGEGSELAGVVHSVGEGADCHGGHVALAVDLGVDPGRINTSTDFAEAKEHGVHANDADQLDDMFGDLEPFIDEVAAGTVEIPIRAEFPLEQVQKVHGNLESSGVGRVVLTVSDDE